jgi:hypothetical protein
MLGSYELRVAPRAAGGNGAVSRAAFRIVG